MTDEIQKRKPEILAPAGSIESVRAAVNAGCDAIYIGGSRFGARAYADNPQGDDMREIGKRRVGKGVEQRVESGGGRGS